MFFQNLQRSHILRNRNTKNLSDISDFDISISEKTLDPEWDNFLLHHPEPHHEQTSLWSVVRQNYGWHPVRLVIRQRGEIVAGAQILERRVAGVLKVGYIARGPVLQEGMDESIFVDLLKKAAKNRRLTYLVASLPYNSYSLARQLKCAGFQLRPDFLPPNIWVKATAILDLSKDINGIFSSLNSTRRWQVRHGMQAGVIVKAGEGEDIPIFYRLLLELCKRRNTKCNVPDETFLHSLWETFHPAGLIKLFIAELNGEAVSALMVITIGKWARAWRIGWSGNYSKQYPNDAVYWEAICWAKKNGFSFFDFVGIDLDDARALSSGRSKSEPFKCPITFFKVSFGGIISILPGDYYYLPNFCMRFLFHTVGWRMIDNRTVRRIFNKLIIMNKLTN